MSWSSRPRHLLVVRFCPWLILLSLACWLSLPARAVILWSDPETTLVHDNGAGVDILDGAVKRDYAANDTLYFKFHVEPISDRDTEDYFAAFELYEGDTERLGIGNALKAWAYSAFFPAGYSSGTNEPADYLDLHTSRPEVSTDGAVNSYQYPRHGVGATMVFKVQYVPGGDDLVTVWLDPDLGPGANEAYQPESLTTRFNANARFDEIRLRHGGKGGGWAFSDLAIATTFSDFVDASSARPAGEILGNPDDSRSLVFQSWQREQGLAAGPIHALLQSRDGYLWLGTDDGLLRFDGLRFVAIGPEDGVRSDRVNGLCEDQSGGLWIALKDFGVTRWQNGRSLTFTRQEGLPSNSVTALAGGDNGEMWIGTDAGLALWRDGKRVSFPAAGKFQGQKVTALQRNRQGEMWMGVQGAGIFHYTHDEFLPVPAAGTGELLKQSHCLLLDQRGRFWVGAGEDYVLCLESNNWSRYRIPRNQIKSHVTVFGEETDGTVWAGSAGGGLVQFRDGKVVGIPESSLPGIHIECMVTDREGRLWMGTETGLSRFRRKSLFTLSQGEGLGYGPALGLAEVEPGVIWVAKTNASIYRWDGRSFNRLAASGLSPHVSPITAVLVTHSGFCWVATTNGLLVYKDPTAAADEARPVDSPRPNISALAEAQDGGLWVGTGDGSLWKMFSGQWRRNTNLVSAHPITALLPQANGGLWIGTDGGGVHHLTAGGLAESDRNQGLVGGQIRSLLEDAQEVLWIATDKGLARWQDGHLTLFTTREGLPDNSIFQVLEDDFGRLWLGTGGGIVCLNKQRLQEVAEGRASALYPQVFGRAEGMLSEVCVGGVYPAGLKSKSGLLWFCTQKGVTVVNPREESTATPSLKTVLDEVLVDGVPASFSPASPADSLPGRPPAHVLRIAPGRHRVEFRYTGLTFDAPESTRFRYRLEGLDGDWVDAGTRRAAFYSYLPAGSYQFRVDACNRDGVWTQNLAGVNLVVLRHFWQNAWFLAFAGVALLVGVAGSARLVEKSKLQRRLKLLEQERALERERTRIAQDLHDEMGAKLCRMSFLSEHACRPDLPAGELREHISSISNAAREVLHSLDEIVWAVNPHNDTLEHAASYIAQYASDYFQMTGVSCVLEVPARLPAHPLSSQMRHHLFLAAHEALTNILKHAGATQARVEMRLERDTFEILISDNGKGFAPEIVKARADAAAGDGLTNMARRMSEIGGVCDIASEPGRGTRVRFVISLTPTTEKVQ